MNKLPRAIAVRYAYGTKYRLVRDEFHGHTLVWKTYQSRPGFVHDWFDCSPHFHARVFALHWFHERFRAVL